MVLQQGLAAGTWISSYLHIVTLVMDHTFLALKKMRLLAVIGWSLLSVSVIYDIRGAGVLFAWRTCMICLHIIITGLRKFNALIPEGKHEHAPSRGTLLGAVPAEGAQALAGLQGDPF